MARNEEKHFCNLNRLILMKEKEEYEKTHPVRPRLDTLDTPEEIQKWLPSIKKDIDFYLKKSQVICYSDAHIEECKEKVIKLEREFKAFVRKIKQLSPSPLEVIPWTSRPYKRKKSDNSIESSSKEFKHIATPILENEKDSYDFILKDKTVQHVGVNWNLMDEPLNFSSKFSTHEKTEKDIKTIANVNLSYLHAENSHSKNSNETRTFQIKGHICSDNDYSLKHKQAEQICSIVNYDSSDSESS